MRFADLIGLTGTFKDAVNGDVAGIAALLFIIFRKERDPQKNRIKQQTARLPQGEYLFLRSSGDEAAAALSFAQFSMWAATKLSHFLIRPRLMQIVTNRKTGDLAPWKISLAALFLYVSLEAPGRYFTTVSAPLVHFEEFRQVEALLWIIWLVGVVIFLSLSVVAIGFLLITLTAAVWMVTQAITSRAFGWASFMDSLMLDMAVEPVPFGSHRLDHFAWDSQPSSAGLTHSWIYEDPAALDRIREWTKSRLQARSS
jgi:hypothetical protein